MIPLTMDSRKMIGDPEDSKQTLYKVTPSGNHQMKVLKRRLQNDSLNFIWFLDVKNFFPCLYIYLAYH